LIKSVLSNNLSYVTKTKSTLHNGPPQAILVSDWSISKYLLFSQMTKTWWEAPMGGSVLSFLKAE
jgi:hypothetical protein